MRSALLGLLGLTILLLPQALTAQTAVEAVPEEMSASEADGPRPGPPPPLPDLSEPNARGGTALNEPDERSDIPRALRSSGSRSGGPANEFNPGAAAEAPASARGDLAGVVAGRELFHGNHCGKGQRGEGLPPIDALDAACMRHDACYDAAGHRSCACDATLRREGAAVSDDPAAPLETRRRALSVTQAATAMGCRAP